MGTRAAQDRDPIHFLHIRKTGGTAIVEALCPVAEHFNIILHGHATKLRDIPPNHGVFFFVRHPIPRFVSGFLSRLRRGMPRYHYEWSEAEARAFARFPTPNALGEALSASDYASRAAAQDAMRSINHVNSNYKDWFGRQQALDDRIHSILLVGLQEELSRAFEYLKKLLGLPNELVLPEDDILAHRTPREFDRRISSLAEDGLTQWYAEDIRFYEHCVEIRSRQRAGIAAERLQY